MRYRPMRVVSLLIAAFLAGVVDHASPVLDDFDPDANGAVYSIAVQPDGKILIGGEFTVIAGQTRNHIARMNADGTLDAAYDPNAYGGPVNSIAVLPDGKSLVGGDFYALGNSIPPTFVSNIARLNADGSLDTAFHAYSGDTVNSIVVQHDGQILVGGGRLHRGYIARLNTDGTVDAAFNPNADGIINSIAVQPDGKVLLGGEFTTIGTANRNRIARLNVDGTLDTAFDPEADGTVISIAVQPDGKILVSGNPEVISGRDILARLNSDGSLDGPFDPSEWGTSVDSVSVQVDGIILAGGYFMGIGDSHANIARLNPNGIADATFNPSVNGLVHATSVQSDGKILMGGSFSTVGGVARNRVARLSADYPAIDELSISSDGARVQWLRSGSGSEIDSVYFEESTDRLAWTSLGHGDRIPGGWELTGLSLPLSQNHYVRARGYAHGGYRNASTSLIESVAMFFHYTLTVSKTGTGSGSVTTEGYGIDCGMDCSELFAANATVTLSAVPDFGPYSSSFAGWSGDCDTNGVVLMDGDKTCTAIFNVVPYAPFVIPDGTGPSLPVLAQKTTADGSLLRIGFDDHCNPQKTNLLYGNLGSISSYAVAGSECGISNPDDWPIGSTTNIWFVLVSDNLSGTESSWGQCSAGERNGTAASAQCGNAMRDNSGYCQ